MISLPKSKHEANSIHNRKSTNKMMNKQKSRMHYLLTSYFLNPTHREISKYIFWIIPKTETRTKKEMIFAPRKKKKKKTDRTPQITRSRNDHKEINDRTTIINWKNRRMGANTVSISIKNNMNTDPKFVP